MITKVHSLSVFHRRCRCSPEINSGPWGVHGERLRAVEIQMLIHVWMYMVSSHLDQNVYPWPWKDGKPYIPEQVQMKGRETCQRSNDTALLLPPSQLWASTSLGIPTIQHRLLAQMQGWKIELQNSCEFPIIPRFSRNPYGSIPWIRGRIRKEWNPARRNPQTGISGKS
jgi:hypothetical protein